MQKRPFILFTAFFFFWTACQREKRFQIPPDLGRGLKPADSLKAVISWLSNQDAYEADTLRLRYTYKLFGMLIRQKPDTLPALLQTMERWAAKSRYPIARGVVALAWAEIFRAQAQHDSALSWAQTGLRTFQEQGRLDYEAIAYYLIGLIYHDQSHHTEALAHHEKALAIRARLGDQRGLAISYNSIGNVHKDQGRYAEASEAYHKALHLFEPMGDYHGIALAYHNISLIYQEQGHYAEALDYEQKALAIWERIGNQHSPALSYSNIGNIYHAQGRYAEGLEAHQKALLIWERIGDERGVAISYNNIGNIYKDQGQYAEGLEYYQKSLQVVRRTGHQQGLAHVYNNIGNIYIEQGRYAEGLKYHQQALAIRAQIGDQQGLATSYDNIGKIYQAQARYPEALECYQKSLQINKRLNDQQGLAISCNSIGNTYREQGLYPTARAYLHQALTLAQYSQMRNELDDIYRSLAQTDSALAASGQPAYWKSAYEYQRLHTAYKDSVFNEESIRKQAQLESQYEHDKKTALLKAQQDKERAVAQAEIQRRETQRNFSLLALGIAIAGIGVLTYLFFIIRRQKRQLQITNTALAESNRIIQAQAEELKRKNTELEIFNAELEATNRALSDSNQVIQAQARALEHKNKEILSSIRYAERIQRVILPSQEKWERLLPDSFLIYQPKDIVAGDFYWLEETERYIFLGVADATGHGVPGAFVSLVCASALNRAVREEGIELPGDILRRARELVSGMLRQEGSKLRDGMDIALMRFEKGAPWRLRYSGANRPLWVITEAGELIEIAGTRQSVSYTEVEKPFEEVELDLSAYGSVMVYSFTDGVVDQMGGPQGRKLLSKGFRPMLLEWHRLPIGEQADRLREFLRQWRGEIEQMDDITLVGVQLG